MIAEMGEQENKKSLNMIAEMGEQENKDLSCLDSFCFLVPKDF
jgi:hypothetical protein